MNKKHFYIVEDGGALATVLTTHLLMVLPGYYNIVRVDSCKNVQAKPGDIILCDQHGVDIEYLQPNGSTVISMSGDNFLKVDLLKPFSTDELDKKINEKTGIFNKTSVLKKVA